MARNRGIKVQIAGEFNPKGFEQAQKAAENFSDQMKGLAKTVGAAFVTREITNFAKSAVSAASDLGESINAVNVTFGEASAGILALGENAATAVGLSSREFNSFAVQFSGFTQQIAGDSGDVVAVTDELTTRIADFASVMNQDIPDAAQVFQSALAGETEPIRKFGIDMSAAAVEAHALATGLVASKSEMTEAIKVQARYSLLMQSTNKVAGDFANTSDSLANQQRILAASLDDAKATIGQALIPALESVLSAVKPLLDAFSDLPDHMQQIIVISGLLAVGMKSLSTTMQGLGLSARTSNKLVLGLGGAMTAGLVILNEYSAAKNEVAAASDRVKQSLDAETGAVTDNTDDIIRQQLMTGELGKAMEMLSLDVDLATEAIMGNDEAAYEFIKTINDADEALVGLGDGFKSLFTSEMQNIDAVRIVRREYQGMRNGMDDAADEAERLADTIQSSSTETYLAESATSHYAKSLQVTQGSLDRMKYSVDKLNDARIAEREALYGTIRSLVKAGEAAGYSTEKTRELIGELGYLDGLSVDAQIELGLVSDVEQALITLDAMILTVQAGARAMGGDARDVVASTRELVDLRNELRRVANAPAAGGGGGGFGGGFTPDIDTVENEFDRFVEQVVSYGNRVLSDDFAKALFEGSAESIADTFDSVMMELAAFAEGTTDTVFDRVIHRLSSKFQDMVVLANLREELQAQLEGIREVQRAAEGLFTTGLEAQGDDGLSLQEQMTERVGLARSFVENIRKLQGMGFPASVIGDIVNAGLVDGAAMAAELSSFDPSQVASFTAQVRELEQLRAEASGIVGGLLGAPQVQEALSATDTAMRDLTEAIQTDLANAFNDFLVGLGAEVDRFTNPSMNNAIVTADEKVRAGINVTVNAGVGTDGVAVGRQIVQILNEYNASGGARLVSDLVGG